MPSLPRVLQTAGLALAVALVSAAGARAQDQAPVACGQPAPGKTVPTVGTLAFSAEASDADLNFKDGTMLDWFTPRFRPRGCLLRRPTRSNAPARPNSSGNLQEALALNPSPYRGRRCWSSRCCFIDPVELRSRRGQACSRTISGMLVAEVVMRVR